MKKSDNFLSNLGLARKANATLSGELLFKNLPLVKLLVLASDASDKTKERVYKKAHFYQLDVIEQFTSNQISRAIAAHNRMVIGITSEDFSRILNLTNEKEEVYESKTKKKTNQTQRSK